MSLRKAAETDVAELLRIHRTPEVTRWWGAPEPEFPWYEDERTTCWVIEADGAVAGWIQVDEEDEPNFRHAAIDLFVDPARHREGLATQAIRTVIDRLVARGHHRVTIDPAAANGGAIACYARLGFREVGVMREHWRDPEGLWRDGLLMEWLASG